MLFLTLLPPLPPKRKKLDYLSLVVAKWCKSEGKICCRCCRRWLPNWAVAAALGNKFPNLRGNNPLTIQFGIKNGSQRRQGEKES
jgi:hypothetical protein